MRNGRYCLAKIYSGGDFNPHARAPLAQPGLNLDVGGYIIEVLKRSIESYWAPRYGMIEHTPNAGIYGPKVMLANEVSGSGGDALPWLFKQAKLGPVVTAGDSSW